MFLQHYFLSHFHSDHTIGLDWTFAAGTIYCSAVTAALITHVLHVAPKFVQPLELGKTFQIEHDMEVTAIDANHCPGSLVFLFHRPSTGQAVIHTGDFRAASCVCTDAVLLSFLQQHTVDVLYLDTTYCKPCYTFPDQKEVLEALGEIAKSELEREPDTVFLVGSYSIGKERAIAAVARALGSKCLISEQRARVLMLAGAMDTEVFTTEDADDVIIRVVPLGGGQMQHETM